MDSHSGWIPAEPLRSEVTITLGFYERPHAGTTLNIVCERRRAPSPLRTLGDRASPHVLYSDKHSPPSCSSEKSAADSGGNFALLKHTRASSAIGFDPFPRRLLLSPESQPPAFVVALLLLPKRSLVLVGKLGATSPSLQHSREGPRRLRPRRMPGWCSPLGLEGTPLPRFLLPGGPVGRRRSRSRETFQIQGRPGLKTSCHGR